MQLEHRHARSVERRKTCGESEEALDYLKTFFSVKTKNCWFSSNSNALVVLYSSSRTLGHIDPTQADVWGRVGVLDVGLRSFEP